MPRSRLRVYHGPENTFDRAQNTETVHSVRVPLGEIFPLLAEAVRSERTWLRDFEEEEISISADLYEVILAYQHCRPPAA